MAIIADFGFADSRSTRLGATNVNISRGKKMTKDNYIIENDNWDEEKPIDRKTVKLSNSDLPEGLEIIETKTSQDEIVEEIRAAAKAEGMDTGNDYLGGEDATPEEVIAALKNEAMPEGAEKAKEEYEEKKVEQLKKTVATRDMLFSRLQKKIPIEVKITNDDGEKEILVFYCRRLSDSENNHLLNHQLIGRELSELTNEEYQESMSFRRKTLAQSIVEPKLTAQEWGEMADNALTLALFEEVQKVISNVDTSEDFQ